MHYLDTSVIITFLTEEDGTEAVRSWIDAQPEGTLAISDWVIAEVPSALSIKVRTGALPIEQRNEVAAMWHGTFINTFVRIAVASNDFDTAGQMAGNHRLSLRAGDALHIAIARSSGCALVTLDKRMAAAALELGVPVAEI